jgi:hypothetical protein
MAVTAGLRDFVDAYVQEHIVNDKLMSSFVQRHPILYWLAGKSMEKLALKGTPSNGLVLGGVNIGAAKRAENANGKEALIRFQKAERNDTDTQEYRDDETPTASGFDSDNADSYGMRWTRWRSPFKVHKHDLDFTRGVKTKIGSIIDDTVGQTCNAALKTVVDDLWNGTLTGPQQEQNLWKKPLGILHTLTPNNYYGRKDRSVATVLNPLNIDAATQLPTTRVSLDIADMVNVGNSSIVGLADKSENGVGARLFICHPALWQTLRVEADAKNIRTISSIPHHPMGGYKHPIIEHNQTYFIADRSLAVGKMAGLNLDTWSFEIHPAGNFRVPSMAEWGEKDKTTEGGAEYYFASMILMARLMCARPDCNVLIENLTTT